MLRYTKTDFEYGVSIVKDNALAFNSKTQIGRNIVVCVDAVYDKARHETAFEHMGKDTTREEWIANTFDVFVEHLIYYALVERTCNATSLPYGKAEYKNQLYYRCKTLCKNSDYKKCSLACQCDIFPTFALRTKHEDVIEEIEDEYELRFKAIQKKHAENRFRYNK